MDIYSSRIEFITFYDFILTTYDITPRRNKKLFFEKIKKSYLKIQSNGKW